MAKNVLLTNANFNPAAKVSLEGYGYQVFVAPDGSEETLMNMIETHDIVATYSRVEQITRRVMESGKGLKVCTQNGIGVDNIDMDAASEMGIKVINLPMGPAYGVAEHTMAFLTALARDLFRLNKITKEGGWPRNEPSQAVEIAGKNLLIVGLGNIGKLVAKKAKALDLVVGAYDPYLDKAEIGRHGVQKLDTLEEGLGWADFVTVHAPLTDETTGMFGEAQFAAMKATAYFMNLGRGPITQQKALYKALVEKQITAAAIDVFEEEPPAADNPLFTLENLIVTPHIAGMTNTAMEKFAKVGAKSIHEALTGGSDYNLMNRQQLEANGKL